MSAKNPKAGRGPCPNCGATGTVFRLSPASGKLSYSCDECDHSAYAEKGGAAHAKWTAAMKPEGVASAPPAAAAASPAPAPRGGGFDLANL